MVVSDNHRFWHNPKQTSKLGWMHMPVRASTKYPLKCCSHVRSESLFCEVPQCMGACQKLAQFARKNKLCSSCKQDTRSNESKLSSCSAVSLPAFWLRLATQLPPTAANVGKSEVKKGMRNSNQQKRNILE